MHGDGSLHGGSKHGSETSHAVGRETFYAREADGSRLTDATRRREIQARLRQILVSHNLHGEVLVRLLHESEMQMVHTVPKIDAAVREQVNIVRCVGKHHKELLHEICDHFEAIGLVVMHADIDTDMRGRDVNVFYVRREDGRLFSDGERTELQKTLLGFYNTHSVDGDVTIEAAEHPGHSRQSKWNILRADHRKSKVNFWSDPQMLSGPAGSYSC